ncbi:hypothetical protein S245_007853 [Arachis hypogaea]
MGLTLLSGAGMPITYWGQAFITAIQLINTFPTPVLHHVSRTEKLLGKESSYESLRVFGCLCFSHLKPYNRHKLDFDLLLVFLGYGIAHKGYTCLTQEGKIIITRNVVFDETHFPFKNGDFLNKNHHMSMTHLKSTPIIPIIPKLPPSVPTISTAPIPSSHHSQPASSQSQFVPPNHPLHPTPPHTNSLIPRLSHP